NVLSFGMKAGMFGNSVDFSDINYRQDGDQLEGTGSVSQLSPNIGMGTFLYSQKYYIGVSVPRLLPSTVAGNSSNPDAKYKRHIFITGGYIFELSPTFKIKPTTLVKLVNSAKPQVDATLNFLIKETLWLGGFYRTSGHAGILAQIQPIDSFRFGYSFDYPFSDLNTIDGFAGSHELMIGYELGNKKSGKFKSPRYF
ncbi:MAG: PorP/SprF family type IX secretion system membrane protein, partial [Cyclobacteriaceae bacterium]